MRWVSILTSIAIHGAILGAMIEWEGEGERLEVEVEGLEIEIEVEGLEDEIEEVSTPQVQPYTSQPQPQPYTSQPQPQSPTTPILTLQPKYPRRARKLGIEGVTQVRVLIGNDGLVKEALLESSSGARDLDKAALEAARGSKFNKVNQVEYRDAILTFEFTLDGKREFVL